MNVTLPPDVRQRLDAHLDAVEQTLAASGRSREQRRGVVDDLEAQIQDMLAAKSSTPTLPDLEAVLTQLDPPSAYTEGTPRAAVPPAQPASCAPVTSPAQIFQTAFPPRKPRYARTAIWGLVCILLSLVPLATLALVAVYFAQQAVHNVMPNAGGPEVQPHFMPNGSVPVWKAWGLLGSCMFVITGPLALASTILGWIAFSQIRAAAGKLRGTGLALFDGLFYPILFLMFSVITPFFLPIVGVALLLACVAVIYIIIRMANGQRVFS